MCAECGGTCGKDDGTSCEVIDRLADVGLATLDDAATCYLTDPAEDEEIEKRLLARALHRALGGPYGGKMVRALIEGTIRFRRRRKGESLEAWAKAYIADIGRKDVAHELDDLYELDPVEWRRVMDRWPTREIDALLHVTSRAVAVGQMSKGEAAMLNMLQLQAVEESSSPEEARRRFQLKVEAVREKAEAARRFDALQEQVRLNHAATAHAVHRGEVEPVRIGPCFNVAARDEELERDMREAAVAREERERQAAAIEQATARFRKRPHPPVLGIPQP
jgi:hypothetical protein